MSQSNAAYILRTKLNAPIQSPPPALPAPVSCAVDPDNSGQSCSSPDADADEAIAVWGDARAHHERLLARLYAQSARHGSKESLLHLGTCYFKGACGVGPASYPKALWYYSKASHLGMPLSSAYLGVMHHFGLGVAANAVRAERYYALSLSQGADQTVSVMIQSLRYALAAKGYFFMKPVNMGVEYVVRMLWKA